MTGEIDEDTEGERIRSNKTTAGIAEHDVEMVKLRPTAASLIIFS